MNQAIVTAARGWLGTRFHHQGRVKRTQAHAGGVDCLGLLIGVAEELQLTNENGECLSCFDETNYPHQPDTLKLRTKLGQVMRYIPLEGMQAGDVLLLNIDGSPQHLAIASDYAGQIGIIHAYAPARCVVEHPLDAWWKARIQAVFRI